MKKRKPKSFFNFNLGEMTVDEVKERLRAQGLPVDSWIDNEGNVKEGDKARLPTLDKCAEMLVQIRGVCEEQMKHDRKEIDDLGYQLRRLTRGGGH